MIKRRCLRNCSSTCYHTMGDYYNMRFFPIGSESTSALVEISGLT